MIDFQTPECFTAVLYNWDRGSKPVHSPGNTPPAFHPPAFLMLSLHTEATAFHDRLPRNKADPVR
jgi:hypothetical protein